MYLESREVLRETSLATLSRLKGIETTNQPLELVPTRRATLATLSRLKGIETCTVARKILGRRGTLATLSRLKGIETNLVSFSFRSSIMLWLRFPV